MRMRPKWLAHFTQQFPRLDFKDGSQALKHIHGCGRSLPFEQAHVSPIHIGKVCTSLLRQTALSAKAPHVSCQNTAERHAASVIVVDFFTTEYILQSLRGRADTKGRLTWAWGKVLRAICMGLMALALVGCKRVDADGNGVTEANQPLILDLLREGDISACAHPAVISIFIDNSRVSFVEAREKLSLTRDQYDAVEPDDISFSEISTTKANKDIAEVECAANLKIMGQNLGVVTYSVRPASAGNGIVAFYDETIGEAISLAKFDHESALKRAVPKAPEPVEQAATSEDSDTSVNEEPEPTPITPYEKAQAALGEDSSAVPSTGN